MDEDDDSRRKGGSAGARDRAARLAAELRANLAKRKQRARKVAATERQSEVEGAENGGREDAT